MSSSVFDSVARPGPSWCYRGVSGWVLTAILNVWKPYAWLYRLALDRLIEEYRRHRRAGRDLKCELPWPDDCSAVLGGQLNDGGTGPLTAAQRAELVDRVNKVLALLPEGDRDLLLMRYFDQLSAREVGDVYSLTENAVNVRVFRALKKLQQLWSQLFSDPESAP